MVESVESDCCGAEGILDEADCDMLNNKFGDSRPAW
jgi:hypothetical protein